MLVPVAAMFLLWRLSAREPDQEPQSTMHSLLHNSMHVIAYGCLAASVWLAWSRKPVTAVHAFRSRGAWLIAAAYGVVDELHQSYVPGRVCSVADLASDAVGAALAILLLRAIAGIGPKSGLMVGALLCFASALGARGAMRVRADVRAYVASGGGGGGGAPTPPPSPAPRPPPSC